MGKSAKVYPLSSGRILACSIAALLLGSEGVTLAQEAVWTGAQSGNWSGAANWQEGAVPSSNPALALRFAPPGSSAITASNDLPGAFSVGSMQFESVAKQIFSLGGNELRITGEAPAIVQVGIGDVTLSTPLLLAPSPGKSVTMISRGAGDLTLSGAITETGGPASLVITGHAKSLRRVF